MILTALVLGLAGCRPDPTPLVWMEGAGFSWVSFNHRISYMSHRLDAEGVNLAMVGGASSTGWAPELPEGCDAETCAEYPFYDQAEVWLSWGRTTLAEGSWGQAEATLVAEAVPTEVSVSIPLDRPGRGTPFVIVQGWTLDTHEPLAGGDACYQPENGWLPTRIALSAGDAALSDDGTTVQATVSAAFEAGVSLEEARECLDDVVDEARVGLAVQVLAVVDPTPPRVEELAFEGQWELGEDQPEPDAADRALDLGGESVLAGWSHLDFRFHEEDPDGRGAYLRSLEVALDPAAGHAWGHATNVSTLTQLSGFSYRFEGKVMVLDLAEPGDRGRVEATLDATLDAEHRPVSQSLPLE